MKVAAIVSGGMDSVTALYLARSMVVDGIVLSFDYGQRHSIELGYAAAAARDVGWPHHVIDLRSVQPLLVGSSLTDDSVPTPEGHYSAETMRKTVVPGRNAIMLALGWAVAAAHDCAAVVCGVHAGDHYIYPDCRPEFVAYLDYALGLGTTGHAQEGLHVWAPFQRMTKVEIVRVGTRLGVPYELTWTCYNPATKLGGGMFDDLLPLACGKCGSCNERREAFATAGIDDPMVYA